MEFLKKNKVVIGIGVAVALIAAVVVIATSSGSSAKQNEQIVVASVGHRTLKDVVTVSGEIQHKKTSTLSMLSQGRITEVGVDDGQAIRSGKEVVAVDGRPSVAEPGDFPFWRPLSEGSVGFDVWQLEKILAAEGFDPGPVDLDFTAQTQKALLAWQKQYGYSAPSPDPDRSLQLSLSPGSGYQVGAEGGAGAVISENPGGSRRNRRLQSSR